MGYFEFKNFETSINLGDEQEKVTLVISDDLEAAYEPLPEDYEKKIVHFLDNIDQWLPQVVARIDSEFDKQVEKKLTNIFILSEPDEDDLIFGVSFWIAEDTEHGRGAKISMNNNQLIEYGHAEDAFS
ncbi:hypothetical protein HZY88_02245 [Aerococcaceae bacterium DSM 111176]|nr:hypothetical protein [Aerococcaceae bacterium DSM 111176]